MRTAFVVLFAVGCAYSPRPYARDPAIGVKARADAAARPLGAEPMPPQPPEGEIGVDPAPESRKN